MSHELWTAVEQSDIDYFRRRTMDDLADPHIRSCFPESPTPLFIALQSINRHNAPQDKQHAIDVFHELLKLALYWADSIPKMQLFVDQIDHQGFSIIHYAARDNLALIIRLLAAYGANIDKPTDNALQWVPLYIAVYFNCPQAAQELCDCGAKMEFSSTSAVQLATQEGHESLSISLRNIVKERKARAKHFLDFSHHHIGSAKTLTPHRLFPLPKTQQASFETESIISQSVFPRRGSI